MTEVGAILHTPFDLGIDVPNEPYGQLRLTHNMIWGTRDGKEWDIEKLVAEFSLDAEFSKFIRIEFDGGIIFRVLDETWLCTATDSTRWTGDMSTWARIVRGDDFAKLHDFYFFVNGDALHYQFVTGSACLDVIACVSPKVTLHS